MFTIYKKEFQWGDKTVVIETGKIARQADGAVLVSMGQTTVLCTAVAAKSAKPGQDFFPLTVNYQDIRIQKLVQCICVLTPFYLLLPL